MNDKLLLKGIFTLHIIEVATGKVLETYEDRNLVVNGGRTAVVNLLGGNVSGRSLTKIAFGTNAVPPANGDNAITGAFTKALGTVSYPTISSVKWDWTLEAAEANGMTIREFGLLCDNNTLFARKTREAIIKTVDVRLVGTWEVGF